MNAPAGSLLLGSPAKIVRQLSAAEIRSMKDNAVAYIAEAKATLTAENW